MKKNILYVTHSDKKGGAEQSLIHLINNLDTTKYNIYLICPPNTEYINEIHKKIHQFNLELGSIKDNIGYKYLKKVFQIKKIIKENQINVIHANGARAPLYIAPLKLIKKNITTFWHHRDRSDSLFFNFCLPFFFNKVICISEYVKQTLSSFHQKNCIVVYNGIDIKNIIGKNTIPQKGNLLEIGVFGRLVPWKRIDYIINALKIYSEKYNDLNWRLLIVGRTDMDDSLKYLDKLKRIVSEGKLERNIIFYGHSNQPLKLMSELSLTINFSDREPFGRVIIESLAVKTPVIVANSGGAPEIINLTGGGIIANDSDILDLVDKIKFIKDMSTENYTAFCENGFNKIYDKFNMKKISKEIEEIYDLY